MALPQPVAQGYATIDINTNTIVIVHGLNESGGGQFRNTYAFSAAPAPVSSMGPLGVSLLLGLLLGAAFVKGRRSSQHA